MSDAKHEIGAVNCGCGWHPSCVKEEKPVTDPAEEAFQRMLAPKKSGHRFTGNDARDAARAALAPLRELHRRNPKLGECMECWRPWPCDTAKLIYPEEEL